MIGERDVVEDGAASVRVERAPAAVRALHAQEPAQPPLDGGRRRSGRGGRPVETHQRPWRCRRGRGRSRCRTGTASRPGSHARALDLPVARHRDLPVDQPVGARGRAGWPAGSPEASERVEGQRGVPDGRHAGCTWKRRGSSSAERLDLLDLARDQRVIVRIAQQPHREDRVHHGGVDAAEAARRRDARHRASRGRPGSRDLASGRGPRRSHVLRNRRRR